ncbi:MAG: hypothetical protein SFT81_02345 [Candidatus Caenarcaniphilales bacterium]|nr:hypothetical protein [Candidatus Caenarcaniphilales bacterium]
MNSGPIVSTTSGGGYQTPFKNAPRPPASDDDARLKQGGLTGERVRNPSTPLPSQTKNPPQIKPEPLQPRGVGERLNVIA